MCIVLILLNFEVFANQRSAPINGDLRQPHKVEKNLKAL
jgi:hypothetical protein